MEKRYSHKNFVDPNIIVENPPLNYEDYLKKINDQITYLQTQNDAIRGTIKGLLPDKDTELFVQAVGKAIAIINNNNEWMSLVEERAYLTSPNGKRDYEEYYNDHLLY